MGNAAPAWGAAGRGIGAAGHMGNAGRIGAAGHMRAAGRTGWACGSMLPVGRHAWAGAARVAAATSPTATGW